MINNFYSKEINSKSKIKHEVKQLFLSSFPKHQIIPLWFLLLKAKKSNIDFLAFYDDDKFIGLTYLIHHEETTYVMYLAIDGKNQSKGYGSKALDLIKSIKKNPKIFLSIDNIDLDAKNYQQRIKRKQFYINNNFVDAKISISIGKDFSDTMAYNCKVDTKLYLSCLGYFCPNFFFKIFLKSGFIKFY